MKNPVSRVENPVVFVRQDHSKLCRFLWRLTPSIRERWFTFGTTIYYPIYANPDNQKVIDHELVHVAQFSRYGKFLFLLFYFILPLPIFFSGRWFLERAAFMIDIKNGMSVENAVRILADQYATPWPRRLMTKWFLRRA